MTAQFRRPSPEEVERELLEALRFKVRDAVHALSGVDRALAELTDLEGFGGDLRPETRKWAKGGISALLSRPAVEALGLEVAG